MKNEDTTHQNLRNSANVIRRGKFIAVNAFIKKEGLKPIIQSSTLRQWENDNLNLKEGEERK